MMILMDVPPSEPAQAFVTISETALASVEQELSARARRDGWSDSQAEWVGKLGAAALDTSGIKGPPTPEVLDAMFRQGRQQLTTGYFDHALEQGKSRLVAFLTVLDLERQIAKRRGETPPEYPETWVKAAYGAVAQAAARGVGSAEQIDIGFAEIRKQASASRVGAAEK